MKIAIVRQSVVEDIDYLAKYMRWADKREIYASNHLSPKEALRIGFEKSIYCRTVENGNPIMMFGVCPISFFDKSAKVWMLGTNDISKISIRFLRGCRHYIDEMLNIYPALYNYVDVRNKKSVKWLEFLGAEFDAPAPYGKEGFNFMRFVFNKENQDVRTGYNTCCNS
jgi:hypothetical protein